MFEIVEQANLKARIKVIGIGGGGGNAVNTMINGKLSGVDFMVANTDAQSLEASRAPVRIQLGSTVTKGLGAGANPEIGRRAALEDEETIKEYLAGSDMIFITAGMGGGTGTGGEAAHYEKEGGQKTWLPEVANETEHGHCHHQRPSSGMSRTRLP